MTSKRVCQGRHGVWVACLCCLFTMFGGCSAALADQGSDGSVQKTVRFGFTVRNPLDRTLTGETLLVYAPASTTNQAVLGLEATHSYQLATDAHGNNLMRFDLPDLAPHATLRIAVTATLALAAVPRRVPLAEDLAFLASEPFIEADHPQIREVGRRLREAGEKGASDAYVDRVYDWVRKRVQYAGFVADDLGALSALRYGRGDCSEYAYLVAALNRSGQVPTKVLGGFVVQSNAVLKAADYHNWNEVYVDGRWQLVDAQKGVLKARTGDYVVMRIVVRHGEEGRERFFHRFLSPSGVVQVEMD